MENKEVFGDCFVNGRIVNLDNATIEEMERYSNENQQLLNDSYRRLDKIAEEIRG